MSRRGQILLFMIIAVLAVLLLVQWLVPGVQLAPEEWPRMIYLLGFLALVGSGAMAGSRRITVSEAVTYSGIWFIIILLLMLGYQLWQQHSLPGGH